jgi:hypothetical protein
MDQPSVQPITITFRDRTFEIPLERFERRSDFTGVEDVIPYLFGDRAKEFLELEPSTQEVAGLLRELYGLALKQAPRAVRRSMGKGRKHPPRMRKKRR